LTCTRWSAVPPGRIRVDPHFQGASGPSTSSSGLLGL